MAASSERGIYTPLKGKSILTSFPPSSMRTRVSFEAAIYQLGAQPLNLQMKLEEPEWIEDKVGNLNCWLDGLVIRYEDQLLVRKIGELSELRSSTA